MKVCHLSTRDTGGGAARMALGLHRALRADGVDSRLCVQHRGSDTAFVQGPASQLEKLQALVSPRLEQLALRRYPGRGPTRFSPANVHSFPWGTLGALTPELVHLHWINAGFVAIEQIGRIKQPLVWTLHDSWPFTGGCHLPFDCTRYQARCGACPNLGSRHEADLSRRVWQRKQRAWRELAIAVVTPSRWLADGARKSALFAGQDVRVIPNGVDAARFRPVEREQARRWLGLPMDRTLILFGAMDAASDANKGFDLLQPALQSLAQNGWGGRAELVVLGMSEPATPPELGLPVHYMGALADDISLALTYAAVDVFVAPSRQENLSTMVLEAMACGTPCVAFQIGGMPDMIEHGVSGYLARPYESRDLAEGIAWVASRGPAQLGANARATIERAFTQARMAADYRRLYETLIARPSLSEPS